MSLTDASRAWEDPDGPDPADSADRAADRRPPQLALLTPMGLRPQRCPGDAAGHPADPHPTRLCPPRVLSGWTATQEAATRVIPNGSDPSLLGGLPMSPQARP